MAWIAGQMIRRTHDSSDRWFVGQMIRRTDDSTDRWLVRWFVGQMIRRTDDSSDRWFVGQMSDRWFVGQMICRTYDSSDRWFVGQMIRRTDYLSDRWFVGQMIRRIYHNILQHTKLCSFCLQTFIHTISYYLYIRSFLLFLQNSANWWRLTECSIMRPVHTIPLVSRCAVCEWHNCSF